jgi:hypothetical protein
VKSASVYSPSVRIVIPIGVFLLSLPLALLAYKEGPFPNMTGGFGDKTCHFCHLDNPLNAPGGSLTIEGVPLSYAPGQTYPITVALTREGMRRGGFEIAARFASGRRRGTQAGSWRLLDERVQLVPSQKHPSLLFVQHNTAGSVARTPGANSWTIEWTAPTPAAGPVQFNVAGNATNDDASALGDYIYLKALRSSPQK